MDSVYRRKERYRLNNLATVNGRRSVTEKVEGGDMPKPDITNIGDVNENGLNIVQQLHVSEDNDGVVLPWLQWETKPDDHQQFGTENLKTIITDKKVKKTLDEEVESNGSVSIFDSRTGVVTSSNGSNCSWSPDSSYLCNMSTHNPSVVESFDLSSTVYSGESRNEKFDYGRNPTVSSTYQDDDFVVHANNGI